MFAQSMQSTYLIIAQTQMFNVWIMVNIKTNCKICDGEDYCTYGQQRGQNTNNCFLAPASGNQNTVTVQSGFQAKHLPERATI